MDLCFDGAPKIPKQILQPRKYSELDKIHTLHCQLLSVGVARALFQMERIWLLLAESGFDAVPYRQQLGVGPQDAGAQGVEGGAQGADKGAVGGSEKARTPSPKDLRQNSHSCRRAPPSHQQGRGS